MAWIMWSIMCQNLCPISIQCSVKRIWKIQLCYSLEGLALHVCTWPSESEFYFRQFRSYKRSYKVCTCTWDRLSLKNLIIFSRMLWCPIKDSICTVQDPSDHAILFMCMPFGHNFISFFLFVCLFVLWHDIVWFGPCWVASIATN